METKLHHFSCTITPNTLGFVIELFEKLGCEVSYRKGKERWCMISQRGFDIQLIESRQKVVPINVKTNTHIGFTSSNPLKDIEAIKKWVKKKGYKFRQGSWYSWAHWFDIPEVFVNFVVEVMIGS